MKQSVSTARSARSCMTFLLCVCLVLTMVSGIAHASGNDDALNAMLYCTGGTDSSDLLELKVTPNQPKGVSEEAIYAITGKVLTVSAPQSPAASSWRWFVSGVSQSSGSEPLNIAPTAQLSWQEPLPLERYTITGDSVRIVIPRLGLDGSTNYYVGCCGLNSAGTPVCFSEVYRLDPVGFMPRAIEITLNGDRLPATDDVSVLASHVVDNDARVEVQVSMWQPKVMPWENGATLDVGYYKGSRDPSDAMLADMTWTVHSGASRAAEEELQGVFESIPPQPGEYTYTVEAPWIITQTKSSVEIPTTSAVLIVADPANPSVPSGVQTVSGTSMNFQCSEIDGRWMMTGLTATKHGTPVRDLLRNTRNSGADQVWILNGYGAVVPTTQYDTAVAAVVATGDYYAEMQQGRIDSYPVIVRGDVIGTGTMSLTQLVRMGEALTGTDPLEGLFLIAGDLSGNGRIDLTDLVQEAQLFMAPGAWAPSADEVGAKPPESSSNLSARQALIQFIQSERANYHTSDVTVSAYDMNAAQAMAEAVAGIDVNYDGGNMLTQEQYMTINRLEIAYYGDDRPSSWANPVSIYTPGDTAQQAVDRIVKQPPTHDWFQKKDVSAIGVGLAQQASGVWICVVILGT